ncbi:AAA-like domain-containing protein [Lusitaniella coriacea]|uniref:AAA-like domain-containing protein n=1 Tax=Lusitaniella coriacea TaxID=1983105 RepID=UPI003CE679D3
MSRSLKVSPQYIPQVKQAVQRNRFPRQRELAEDLQLSLSTVSSFLNGRPVDFLNFLEICARLGQNWQEIADFEERKDFPSPEIDSELLEIEPESDVPYYIERPPVESRCLATVQQQGSLLRIKASRWMGKTSLIDRILAFAATENYRAISLSLLLADGLILNGLDEFLRWFCVVISRQLGLPAMLDEYWEEGLGSSYNCTLYFEEYLLSQINSPLVLAIDEVDRIFSASFAGDFLGMLRAWHEKAKSRPLWQKLRLIVAHSTEVYISLDINHSPFNVGIPIELPEFSAEQVRGLAQQQGITWNAAQVEQIMDCVGGHPHLVQRAIHCLKNQTVSFEELLETAPTEAGTYSTHLRGHLCNLREHPELAAAMKQVVDATEPVQLESTQAFKLQSLGLAVLERNAVKPRSRLYAEYFRERL